VHSNCGPHCCGRRAFLDGTALLHFRKHYSHFIAGKFPLLPPKLIADFPILAERPHGQRLAYLDSAASSQRPQTVIDALTEVYQHGYANVHRGIHMLSERATENYEIARSRVAQFINASETAEVIFTSGATMALNLVAQSWGRKFLREGDEILLTIMEHHSNIVPWQQIAEQTGAVIRFAPLDDAGRLDLETLDRLLTEKTKVFAFVAVSNMLGTINPVTELVQRAHAVGAIAVVDACQSVPHVHTDVQASGADFIAFSGHKMLGPSGVGILWGKRDLLEAMPPFLGGGSMIRRVTVDGFKPGELPAKFEAGTPPIADAIGLTPAIDYLNSVGLDKIHRHEQELAELCHNALAELGGVKIFGPPPAEKAGIVTFVLDDVHPADLSQLIDREGVAIRSGHHCTMPLHKELGVRATSRASFYLYNTPEDVEQLVRAIGQVRAKLGV
jgi:cysteine desulfurase/selenocysteine lyase